MTKQEILEQLIERVKADQDAIRMSVRINAQDINRLTAQNTVSKRHIALLGQFIKETRKKFRLEAKP